MRISSKMEKNNCVVEMVAKRNAQLHHRQCLVCVPPPLLSLRPSIAVLVALLALRYPSSSSRHCYCIPFLSTVPLLQLIGRSAKEWRCVGAMGEESPQYTLRCQLFGHEEDVSVLYLLGCLHSFRAHLCIVLLDERSFLVFDYELDRVFHLD
jgi:hypothetical protein